ncbi:MAG TPA: hypothetical protein VFX80_05965 [Solirubrobacteraceae bacterium]|nr:hypothetical protein [Solirubrobacteraceae bacterium]
MTRPPVVCLCGSTRFKDEFEAANKRLTLEGKIVLSVGFFTHAEANGGAGDKEVVYGEELAARMDALHKAKIDMADSILVLNRGGYVGDSTASEVAYALATGKRVEWLEPTA